MENTDDRRLQEIKPTGFLTLQDKKTKKKGIMKFTSLRCLLIFFLPLFVSNCVFAQTPEKKNPLIRVAVIRGAESLKVRVRGQHKILTLYTNELLKEGKSLKKSVVVPTIAGLKIGDDEYKIFGIKIVARRKAAIYLNNRLFRGQVDLIRQQDLTLLVINYVEVEDYLRGVIPAEISSRWPLAALKAQAVAARTYAYYQMEQNKEREFDLVSTVFSQLYVGRKAERRRSNRAVAGTRGEVLTFEDRLFPSFYHACCGGHTEEAGRLWKKIDLTPLRGVECPYCRESPHYHWKRKVSLEEIKSMLNKSGFRFIGVSLVAVEERDERGRVSRVRVDHTTGVELFSGNEFRLYLGPDLIKSTNFTVGVKSGYAEFSGLGWGHGVGLCQWGAFFMAREKKGYREILKFYYPETEIVKIDKVK